MGMNVTTFVQFIELMMNAHTDRYNSINMDGKVWAVLGSSSNSNLFLEAHLVARRRLLWSRWVQAESLPTEATNVN